MNCVRIHYTFGHHRKLYAKREENIIGGLRSFLRTNYLPNRFVHGFIERVAPLVRGRVLDLGCGSKPYERYFTSQAYFGVDIENPAHPHADEDVDVFYDGKHLPFDDETFDTVVCFEVLEHVDDLAQVASEVGRVLKPRGLFVFTTPFTWHEHESPYDFRRTSVHGVPLIAAAVGGRVVDVVKTGRGVAFVPAFINSVIGALLGEIRTGSRSGTVYALARLLSLPFIIGLNLSGILLSWVVAPASVYFGVGAAVEKAESGAASSTKAIS